MRAFRRAAHDDNVVQGENGAADDEHEQEAGGVSSRGRVRLRCTARRRAGEPGGGGGE